MKQVDELIRGELSAIRSFDVALERLNDESERQQLSMMREDHVKAVDTLKRYSENELEAGTQSSGPWGAFTQAFTGGASLFGDKAAIKALKVGEEHGRKEYQEALRNGDIDSSLREVITNELLPAQERHIRTIESYIQ